MVAFFITQLNCQLPDKRAEKDLIVVFLQR